MQTVLNTDTVEQVLEGQSLWEDSVVGGVCVAQCVDQQRLKLKTQSLIRGIVNARSRRAKGSLNIFYLSWRDTVAYVWCKF